MYASFVKSFRKENPHWMTDAHKQLPQKLNEWAATVDDIIIGPFSFDMPLTGQSFKHDKVS